MQVGTAPLRAHAAGSDSTVHSACQSRLASRLALLGDKPTVWQEFSPLAVQVGAINLGQGFPNWATPRFVKDAICRAVEQDFNQYTNSEGHPALRQQLAKKYGPSLVGRPLDWQTEVAVGVGSSESLFACMQALVNPGDEVLMLSVVGLVLFVGGLAQEADVAAAVGARRPGRRCLIANPPCTSNRRRPARPRYRSCSAGAASG